MGVPSIDETILSFVEPRWKKVAKVIYQVTVKMSDRLPEGDEGCQIVSRHIESLVSDGRLVAQGNTKNWRHSEIRRPS